MDKFARPSVDQTVTDRFAEARAHLTGGAPSAAESVLASLRREAPKESRVFWLSALAATERGDARAALDHATRAVALEPSVGLYQAVQARAHAAVGDQEAAERHTLWAMLLEGLGSDDSQWAEKILRRLDPARFDALLGETADKGPELAAETAIGLIAEREGAPRRALAAYRMARFRDTSPLFRPWRLGMARCLFGIAPATADRTGLFAPLLEEVRKAPPPEIGPAPPAGAPPRLWQIFFDPAHRASLDPTLIPWDNTANPFPHLFECYVFLEAWKRGDMDTEDVTGFLSPRFGDKTGLRGARLRAWIAAHPGYDLYVCNPYPEEAARSWNVWTQGEREHPGLIEAATPLFARAGIDLPEVARRRMSWETAVYSNFWAGTRAFWDHYIGVLRAILDPVIAEDYTIRDPRYFEATSYRYPAPLFPFIIERVLPTLLISEAGRWSIGVHPMNQEKRRDLMVQPTASYHLWLGPALETVEGDEAGLMSLFTALALS